MIRCKAWFHVLKNAPKDSALYHAWGDVLPPKFPARGIRYEGGAAVPPGWRPPPLFQTPPYPAPAYRAVPFNGLRDMGAWRYFCVTGQWKAVPGLWGWNLGLVLAWGRLPEDWFEQT